MCSEVFEKAVLGSEGAGFWGVFGCDQGMHCDCYCFLCLFLTLGGEEHDGCAKSYCLTASYIHNIHASEHPIHEYSYKSMQMSPLGDRVLIKPKEKEEVRWCYMMMMPSLVYISTHKCCSSMFFLQLQKSAGGVILTAGSSGSSMGDSTLTGTVVAVGDEVDVGVAAGDVVLFTKYGSSELETDEGSVNFVVQKSILAKLE